MSRKEIGKRTRNDIAIENEHEKEKEKIEMSKPKHHEDFDDETHDNDNDDLEDTKIFENDDTQHKHESKRREVTAAVPGMTVSQMRRLLAAVRARLGRQNEHAPFSLIEEIAPGVVTWELCTRVAVGLHEKRTRSRTREKKQHGDST